MNNIYLYIALGVVAILAIGGFYYPVSQQFVATSATGTTFSSAKVADVVFAPQSNTSSSTSILNSDASDRFVKSAHYFCSGMNANFFGATASGISALRFQIATGTSATPPNPLANTNAILDTNVASSTYTVVLAASSTPGDTAVQEDYRWPSGTYLNITSNATSSAASCVIGIDYAAS